MAQSMRRLRQLSCLVLLTSASLQAEPYLVSPEAISPEAASAIRHQADETENRFALARLTFVDRSDPLTVLREERTLALVRLWQTPRARLFFGIGPTGFAGLNFTSRRSFLKRRSRATVPDHSATIRTLTHSAH